MSGRTLHPNLARLAVAYDWVIGRLGRGELTDARALQEIQELVARDDQGVQWSINARSGRWQRKELGGAWVEAVPPEFGLRTATPHDFAAPGSVGLDPESQLRLVEVDLARVVGTGAGGMELAGATLQPQTPVRRHRGRRLLTGAGVAAVVAVACLVWWPGSHATPPGVVSPSPFVHTPAASPHPAAPQHPTGHQRRR